MYGLRVSQTHDTWFVYDLTMRRAERGKLGYDLTFRREEHRNHLYDLTLRFAQRRCFLHSAYTLRQARKTSIRFTVRRAERAK